MPMIFVCKRNTVKEGIKIFHEAVTIFMESQQ